MEINLGITLNPLSNHLLQDFTLTIYSGFLHKCKPCQNYSSVATQTMPFWRLLLISFKCKSKKDNKSSICDMVPCNSDQFICFILHSMKSDCHFSPCLQFNKILQLTSIPQPVFLSCLILWMSLNLICLSAFVSVSCLKSLTGGTAANTSC